MPEENKIKNFYNDLYGRKKEKTMRPFYVYKRWVEFFSPQEGNKIFDIGCGTGYFLKASEEKGLKTYGIDISDEAVKVAKEIARNSQIEVGEGENLKYPDNFFNYISCLGSLEHFTDLEKGLREMIRVAKKGAKFLIIVPNINYLWDKVVGKKGTIQRDYKEELKDLNSWKKLFNNYGLKIEKIVQDKYPAEIVKIFEYKNPVKILRRIIYRLIWVFMPLKYTYQFIFILKRC